MFIKDVILFMHQHYISFQDLTLKILKKQINFLIYLLINKVLLYVTYFTLKNPLASSYISYEQLSSLVFSSI